MPTRPEIFISAASRDLKSCRQLVRDALLTLGCVPVVQDHFPPGAGEVRAMLRERIAGCQAVIHLAGECYGHESQERAPSDPRRSYTQLEYDLARELKKPLYTFLCAPDFPYDPHDAEPPDLRALQDAHRAALAAGDSLYLPIKNPRELAERVRELQTRVDSLSRDLQKTRGWLGRGIAATAVALLLVAGLLYVVKRQGEQGQARAEERASKAEAQLAALTGQLQQQTKIISLVNEKLDRNDTAAAGLDKGDPAAAARAAAAQQLGISTEELEKKLAGENTDLHVLYAQVEAATASAAAKAAEWQKLKRDTLTKLGDAEFAAGHWGTAIEPYRQALALSDEHDEPLAWCNAAQKLEFTLWRMWRNADAEPLARKVLEKRAQLQGPDHPDALKSAYHLMGVLLVKGDLAGAETLGRRTLEAQERTLGKDHPDTLSSVEYVADLLDEKYDQPGAEALFRRCLEARERTLGKDHPDTLESVSDLAASLMEKGDYDGAETLDRRCVEARTRTLGNEHRLTLTSLANLAYVLMNKGDLDEAEPLFRHSLETRERVLGKDDPDTLNGVEGLSGLLYYKGDLAAAVALDRRVLEAMERTLGKDHSGTLNAANNLAADLRKLGKLPEAEMLCRHALTAQERTLGTSDPDTLASVKQLAEIEEAKGETATAEALYLRAQTGMEHVVPPEHPYRLDLGYNFSLLRQKQGRMSDALTLAEITVTGAQQTLPEKNPDRLKYEKYLADLRAKLAAASPAPPIHPP